MKKKIYKLTNGTYIRVFEDRESAEAAKNGDDFDIIEMELSTFSEFKENACKKFGINGFLIDWGTNFGSIGAFPPSFTKPDIPRWVLLKDGLRVESVMGCLYYEAFQNPGYPLVINDNGKDSPLVSLDGEKAWYSNGSIGVITEKGFELWKDIKTFREYKKLKKEKNNVEET